MSAAIRGVCAAVLTPLTARMQPDADKAVRYYERLLAQGCDALNVLGTTGEAMSLSLRQRLDFMERLASSGRLPLNRIMVGTGSAALADAAELNRVAAQCGFAGVLIMPPFFYGNVPDDGIVRFFDALFASAPPRESSVYLYHFPRMSGISFSISLIGKLVSAFPGVFAGLKDSSNDLPFADAIAERYPHLAVFPSAETHLLRARKKGLAGCISGSVSLWPQIAARIWSGEMRSAAPIQLRLSELRRAVASDDLLGAVRSLTSLEERDESWNVPLPPLLPLDDWARGRMRKTLSEAGYAPADPLARS